MDWNSIDLIIFFYVSYLLRSICRLVIIRNYINNDWCWGSLFICFDVIILSFWYNRNRRNLVFLISICYADSCKSIMSYLFATPTRRGDKGKFCPNTDTLYLTDILLSGHSTLRISLFCKYFMKRALLINRYLKFADASLTRWFLPVNTLL